MGNFKLLIYNPIVGLPSCCLLYNLSYVLLQMKLLSDMQECEKQRTRLSCNECKDLELIPALWSEDILRPT